MSVFQKFIGLAFFLVMAACASVVGPSGGPRDLQPPRIDTANSTPNFQTRFLKQPIKLTFDEWVQLNNVSEQVVISPPLEYRPDIRLKKRSLLFDFDERESLRPDATYTINFGEAVQDLTERNPAEDLRFVFATGNVLDSLSVTGQLIDAQTGDPVEDMLFMLYENTVDSVVRTERPFYFGQTGDNGRFEIKNVKEGTFKGFALKDVDNNYRYNRPSELIGFPKNLIEVSPEREPIVNVRVFQELPEFQLLNTDQRTNGRLRLQFNQPPTDLLVEPEPINVEWFTEVVQDSLLLWYYRADTSDWRVFVRFNSTTRDTVLVRGFSAPPQRVVAPVKPSSKRVEEKVKPGDPVSIEFDQPIRSIDTSQAIFLEDANRLSSTSYDLSVDSLMPRKVILKYPWKTGPDYRLEFAPGMIRGWFGENQDTLTFRYQVIPKEDLGNLNLRLTGLDSTLQYSIKLIAQGKSGLPDLQVQGQSEILWELRKLDPGRYQVEIIIDKNGNGRWDPGVYDLGLQPETILSFPLEQLRANWDLEAEINIQQQE